MHGPRRRRSLLRDERGLRPTPGLLFVPFVVGAGFVLLVAAGTRREIDLFWVLLAVLAGIILAAAFLMTSLVTRTPRALADAALSPHQEARGRDPLANIHAVERQGRRHRRPCTNCGTPVKMDRQVCPSCGHQQLYACKGCKTQVRLEWTNCPECGRGLP